MPLLYMKVITRKFVQEHPDWIFLFGDNVERWGHGGQAKAMRGEPNAFGVATKWAPTHVEAAYFTDDPKCWAIITKDMTKVTALVQEGKIVVCPLDGLGTGRAELDKRAPRILNYIRNTLKALDHVG